MRIDSSELIMSGENATENVTREGVLELVRQRNNIDENIQALGQILRSNNIGMTEPLVDREGFPRNDIDVYQVRHARHKIICLQNDFKSLTKEIEQKMLILHQNPSNESDASPMDISEREEARRRVPIALVNLVSEGSPAFHAGLQCDDLILSFGSVDSENFRSIADIGGIVQRSRGQLVNVTVKRRSNIVKLALIPGEWSGRGLLGCNIVPVENIDR